jgi:hypothetical protein
VEGVKNNNRKYSRVRKLYNNNTSGGSGTFEVKNSCRECLCLCCGKYKARRQGSSMGIVTFYGKSSGGSCMCVCVVRGMGGWQGPSGSDCSTAGAGLAGHCRQWYGTESMQLSRQQSSWQLTTAERIVNSDSCRENIPRCVQLLQNLTGTALFKRDRYRVILLKRIVYICCYYISMRIYLGKRLALDGVEVIGHV